MMTSEIDKVFSLTELEGLQDFELLGLLKKNWGYDADRPFEVVAQLNEHKNTGTSFFACSNIRHIDTGARLFYPVEYVTQTIYVGSFQSGKTPASISNKAWIRCLVELSPKKERDKHENPFELKANISTIKNLTALPEEFTTVLSADGRYLVEDGLVDYLKDKNRAEISSHSESLRRQFEAEQQTQHSIVHSLKEQASSLSERITTEELQLQSVQESLGHIIKQHEVTSNMFFRNKKTMEQQLDTLHLFIEQKSKLLQQLDLVEADWVTGANLSERDTCREGHDFLEIFDSDPKRAIGYIQAYMHRKGIYYRKKVLEDFFALLCTHDLIILAGDSGSGKTNLVKSFADAIGGKAIIVPVKPNWTSAEDLLGYYNPLDQKYLATPFLEAMLEAAKNPDIPYFICLDEMNLARVEYYFADFLSLLEERGHLPEIPLYSNSEETHLVSEARNFLALIDDAKVKLNRPDAVSFLDLLRDEAINAKLHELCGFREGDSLLKYHGQLRKLLSSYLTTPSKLKLPINVRIVGAINVDETTHYLSPKILDRAHIMRFGSPLLSNWDEIDREIDSDVELDLSLPVHFSPQMLGQREIYPEFDRQDSLVLTLIQLARGYLEPLGIEFGLRTVRQARNYQKALEVFGHDESLVLNNIVLHKVLPKLMFDGEKQGGNGLLRKDILIQLRGFLAQRLGATATRTDIDSCVKELDRVIEAAKANDWAVNYWSR